MGGLWGAACALPGISCWCRGRGQRCKQMCQVGVQAGLPDCLDVCVVVVVMGGGAETPVLDPFGRLSPSRRGQVGCRSVGPSGRETDGRRGEGGQANCTNMLHKHLCHPVVGRNSGLQLVGRKLWTPF